MPSAIEPGPPAKARREHRLTPEMEARKWRPGQSGNPKGRTPCKASRIAAVLEGFRRRYNKESAEEAIAEAVRTCPEGDIRHYLAMVMPKQEDPENQVQKIVIHPMVYKPEGPIRDTGGDDSRALNYRSEHNVGR